MVNLSTEISKIQENKALSLVSAVLQAARPIQWIKNLAIFAALIFTGDFYDRILFHQVLLAFVTFCFATSATYIFNDILDAKKDALHPIKKRRPIPSGRLPISLALIFSAIFALMALTVSLDLNELFFYAVLAYLVIQIFYSLFLKKLAIIDILVIATGFVIRVYAGAFVINAHLSVWFLLCVISTALFLAAGKRRAELGVIVNTTGETRQSLTHYSKPLLDSFVTMFGNAAWLSWAMFTFFESPRASLPIWLFLAEISKTTTINKLLMVTIPVTIFAIMRYESLIFADRSEAPEKVLLSDKSLVVSVFIWILLVVWIYYGGLSIAFH